MPTEVPKDIKDSVAKILDQMKKDHNIAGDKIDLTPIGRADPMWSITYKTVV